MTKRLWQYTIEKFDEEVSEIPKKHKGSTQQKLEKLAETMYNEQDERYGLKSNDSTKPKPNRIFSRKQEKLKNIRTEKKKLENRWNKANE